MDFGDWEGRPWADIARGEIDAWTQDCPLPPGAGENLHSMLARVDAARRETLKGLEQGRPRGVDHARRRHALRGVAGAAHGGNRRYRTNGRWKRQAGEIG